MSKRAKKSSPKPRQETANHGEITAAWSTGKHVLAVMFHSELQVVVIGRWSYTASGDLRPTTINVPFRSRHLETLINALKEVQRRAELKHESQPKEPESLPEESPQSIWATG